MSRSRNYCWTLNNYSEKDVEHIKTIDCKYLVFGKEIAKSGTLHLQGYIELSNSKSLSAVKKLFKCKSLHLEKRKGTPLEASIYCKKDDKKYFETGELSSPGKRNDLSEMLLKIKDGATMIEIQEEYTGNYLRYSNGIHRMKTNYELEKQQQHLRTFSKALKLRSWQSEILDKLLKQDERKVLWILDPIGGKGKTVLAKYLVGLHNAFYVGNGKSADISYAYQNQEIVVFDFTRSLEDYVNYQIIESFKNGMLFSPKYNSLTKIFKPCKVLVLSNFEPNLSKLSKDRWEVVIL